MGPLPGPARGDRPALPRGLGARRRRGLPAGRHPPGLHRRLLRRRLPRRSRRSCPDLHVHAFSALEVWQGAATLGVPLARLPRAPARRRARLAARAPRRRSSTTRCRRVLCPDKVNTRSGSRCTRPLTGPACARRRRSCTARRGAAQLGAPPPAPARAAEAHGRLHGVRAAAVRAHGGADLPARAAPGRGPTFREASSCTPSPVSPCIPTSRTCRPRG